MSFNLGVIGTAVTLDTSDYDRKMAGLPETAESNLKKVAGAISAYLSARALFGFAREVTNEFAVLQEACNKFDAVFGAIPETAAHVERELRKTFKLSEQTSKNMLSGIADQLQAFGMSVPQSLAMARKAAERGIDLASFKGGTQQDAVDSISAALTGETERMKRYGVVIQQGNEAFTARIKAVQAATGATEQMAKAEVIMEQILEQSKNAAGDYLRPGATLAQTKMDIAENTKRATAAMGEELAVGIHPLLQGYNALLTGFNEADPATRKLIMTTAALTSGLVLLQTGFGKALNAKIAYTAQYALNGKAAQLEAAAVEAAEKQKELAAARSAASREALEKRRHLLEMQNAVKEAAAVVQAERVKRAAAMSVGPLSKSAQTGFDKSVTAAENAYAAAKRNVVAANQAYIVSANTAKAIRTQEVAQTELATAAQNKLTLAQNMGGRAAMLLTGGFRAASLAVKSFFVSLGPVGWAMLAIAGITTAMNYMSAAAERAAEKSRKMADAATAAADELTQRQTKMMAQLKRLEMLVGYEKLNNAEMKEAERLIKALGMGEEIYTERIDEGTGKLVLRRKTMQELREEMIRLETAKRKAALEDSVAKQEQAVRDVQDKNRSAAVPRAQARFNEEIAKARLDPANKGKDVYSLEFEMEIKGKVLDEEWKKIPEVAAQMEQLSREKEKLEALNNGVTIEMNDDEVAEANEKVRKLRESLKEREWQIKFDAAEPEEQLDMIAEKIDEINARILQARGNEEEVLKLQRELLDLEEQRAKTRQKIADETKRNAEAIENERRQAEKIEEDRNQRRAEKELDRKLDRMMQQGDRSGALKIMENQLEQARQAAEIMKRQYEQAYRDATADGKITEEEQKQLDERRRKYEEAMAQEEKWSDRLADEKSRDTRRNEAVGGFSAQMLNLQLGSGSAEERTARATEKNAAELEALRRWLRMNMPKRTDGEIEEQGETYDA
ncbi:MAG: hypothetical protein HP002_02405 [Lentisphaeria bacterium]|nr:hypothetical protein [Lentisphaeria bacterium]